MSHRSTTYIHKTAVKVVEHLIAEDGICEHTAKALAAMFDVTEQTIYVVRHHLPGCPDSHGHTLPYRMSGPLVLTDPNGVETLADLQQERAQPIMEACDSVIAMTTKMRAVNVTGIDALEKEARGAGLHDLADALGWAAADIRTTGTISPAVRFRLEQLGVLTKKP